MKLPRFFAAELAGDLAAEREIALPDDVAHHAAKVLRLRIGDPVTLFTGTGGEFSATILRIDKRGVTVRVDAFVAVERESPLRTTLVQGVAAGDAMDYAVRKAVELGAAAIQPVITQRSAPLPEGARGAQRHAHWQQITVAACEQCGRDRIPVVHPVARFHAWLDSRERGDGIVLAPEGATPLARIPAPQSRIDVVIGPEGGFAPEEVAAAVRAGLVAVTLGPRILRTETAGPAALAAINTLWGDFR